MNLNYTRIITKVAVEKMLFATALLVFLSLGSLAQSQALNGQIEGVITDANGASLPNAKIQVTNLDTGTTREATSDTNGLYRIPLLPLGTYKITVESPGFKRLIRAGVTLTTGQIATVEFRLDTGAVSEEVTITADAPIADLGKIDVGRVMNKREVKNLPLVSRNPYNFALLQANVTGRTNSEFGVPRINANGFARRTNYQLDGNNNTQTDRAGIRLMPLSEIFVSEVQLVTNGFAAEFGNTPGLIMNAVTPSGTNQLHGNASYRFRRTAFSARPFFFAGANKPPAIVDDIAGAVGGPLVKDRWHFFTGYEHVVRDLGGEPARALTITEANKAALIAAGVPASAFPANIPTKQKVDFLSCALTCNWTA
ncbi:MAG: carboxypeptidase regulatory-like domain-containing protein, partial [Blastocatellia bacterium]|nr:carboxypeptidase regulatory-like domain-containing protein [Blastocatellia bacterium]